MTNQDIQTVYHNGKSVADRYLVMYIFPNEAGPRLAVSVSKKLGNSVVRHRVKRIVTAAFREVCPQLPKSYDYVIIARTGCIDKKSTDLIVSFQSLIHKLSHISE